MIGKKTCLLLALCLLTLLAAAPFAGAESVVSPDGRFEVTMAAADYMDNWDEAVGDFTFYDEPTAGTHRFYLHIFILDELTQYTYDGLSEIFFNWHMEDPDGNMYWLCTYSADKIHDRYREADVVFQCFEERVGSKEFTLEDMKLYMYPSTQAIFLAGVPHDKPLAREVTTPAPTVSPAYADRLMHLVNGVRTGTLAAKTPSDGSWPKAWGSVALAVFDSEEPDCDPVLSWLDPDDFSMIPKALLADSLDEADHLILIHARHIYTGYYGNTTNSAYRTETNLTIVDLASEEMYPTVLIAVEEPPQTVHEYGDHYGLFRVQDALDTAAEKIAAAREE